MIVYENECVMCDIPCIDCGRKRVPHFYCDNCGEEKKLYEDGFEQLCAECILENYDVVDGSEYNGD